MLSYYVLIAGSMHGGHARTHTITVARIACADPRGVRLDLAFGLA